MAFHGCGTALVFARTETALFHRTIWEKATAILFFEGRLFFHHVDGRRADNNAGAPSCLVAYGMNDAQRICAAQHSLKGKFIWLRPPR